jgi:hypothetical protein
VQNLTGFDTLKGCAGYLRDALPVGTEKSTVMRFLTDNNVFYRAFGASGMGNVTSRGLFSTTADYNSVIEINLTVERPYLWFFSTEFIWMIRFHFRDSQLVEITGRQIENFPP